MIIESTPLMPFGGAALTSDNQLITAMMRPPNHPCGGQRFVVSDEMRHAMSVRCAIKMGWITVTMDSDDSSDWVAQVELNDLAIIVSGISGFSGSVSQERCIFLDIHGAEDTAEIKDINGTPYLVFHDGVENRATWTISVPEDYVASTDMTLDVYWTPSDASIGNVSWTLQYKITASGATVATGLSTSSIIQAAPGATNVLETTGSSLSIPSSSIVSGALITLGVVRNGAAVSDTYTGKAQVHHSKLCYTGKTAASSGTSGTPGIRFLNLDFHGAADTAEIKVVDDVPYLQFSKNSTCRSIWTATVPEDYQSGTDMFVEVYWSPTDDDVGSVQWLLEYKSISPGGSLAGVSATSSLTQAAIGTAKVVQTTGTSLIIPAAALSANALLSISVSRLGKHISDTYTGKARVHVVRLRYTGLIFN